MAAKMEKKEESDKENLDPSLYPAKKRRVSLSLPKPDRFHFETDDEELLQAMKGNTVKNTAPNNKWALNNFSQWFCERKEMLALQDSRQPLDVLLTDDADKLCQLSFLVMETRKEDGSEYTPKSLYFIVAGLQRVIKLEKGHSFSFNIFSDTRFESFHNVFDHKFQKLHEQGIGAKSQHVSAITDDDEKKLWDSNILNLSTPSGLLNCVFFYNGKNLCLRGDEHRKLRFSQFH